MVVYCIGVIISFLTTHTHMHSPSILIVIIQRRSLSQLASRDWRWHFRSSDLSVGALCKRELRGCSLQRGRQLKSLTLHCLPRLASNERERSNSNLPCCAHPLLYMTPSFHEPYLGTFSSVTAPQCVYILLTHGFLSTSHAWRALEGTIVLEGAWWCKKHHKSDLGKANDCA